MFEVRLKRERGERASEAFILTGAKEFSDGRIWQLKPGTQRGGGC